MSDAELGTGPLWNTPGLHLPRPIRAVARALMREEGFTKEHAIATAVSRGRRWAAGGNAKWVRAMAEWEAAKAKAHAHPNKSDRGRADLARPGHESTELTSMGLPPEFLNKKKTPKGGAPIDGVAAVRKAAAAWQTMPPGPKKEAAKARLLASARKVGPAALKFVPGGGGKGAS